MRAAREKPRLSTPTAESNFNVIEFNEWRQFAISASAKLRGIENCSHVLHNVPSILSTHIPTHMENKGYPSVRILNLDNAGSGDGR